MSVFLSHFVVSQVAIRNTIQIFLLLYFSISLNVSLHPVMEAVPCLYKCQSKSGNYSASVGTVHSVQLTEIHENMETVLEKLKYDENKLDLIFKN